MSVYRKLMEVRVAFNKLKLNKSGHNKFAGYTYFELGDFIPQAQELFASVGLCGVVSYGKDMATLTIQDMDGDGKIEITSPMADAMLKGCHPIQNLGAVETYTRRYLWVTALEIVEHDALDSSAPLKSRITPTAGVFESQSPEVQQVIIETAANIESAWESDLEAAIKIFEDAVEGDNDIKIALWSKLGSKCRAAIKKEKAK